MRYRIPSASSCLAAACVSMLVLAGCNRGAPEPPPGPAAVDPEQDELPHVVRPVIVRPSATAEQNQAADMEGVVASTPDPEPDPVPAPTPVRVPPAQPAPTRPLATTRDPAPRVATEEAPPAARPAPVRPEPTPRPVATRPPPEPMPERPPPAPRPVSGGDARSLNREAIALIGAGRPEQAIAPLERAVAMQPNDAEMLGNLGYAYMLTGDNARARARLMRSLDIAPTRSATWLNLGQTWAELGERDRAVDAVLTGYRHSTRKDAVRSALQRATAGGRHSAEWREVANLALEQIGG